MNKLSEFESEEGVDFNRIARAFCNLVEKIHLANKVLKAKFAETAISLISRFDWIANLEKQKMMKRLITLAVSKLTTEIFVAHWSSKLLIEKRKIESEIITQWVTQWSRQGSTQDKQAWEQFIKRFVLEVRITASTTAQTCHMEWRDC